MRETGSRLGEVAVGRMLGRMSVNDVPLSSSHF